MNKILPTWAIPVNIFQILGTTCCSNMAREYSQKNLSRQHFCYDATTIFEANMMVIWGSISTKLSADINDYLKYLPSNHFILHINGCESRVHNHISSSNLSAVFAAKTLSKCLFKKSDFTQLIREARQCLKA